MARWEIRFHTDPDPEMTGWWLVLVDPEAPAGPYDDSVGPYDDFLTAQTMQRIPN